MTNKKLQELFQKSIEICSENGYEPVKLVPYCFYSKDHNTYGKCYECYDNKGNICMTRIAINKELVKRGTEKQIFETLLHECVHSAVGYKEGHEGKWRRAIRKLNKLYNLKIKVSPIYRDDNGDKILDEFAIAKYCVICNKCYYSKYFFSECKTIEKYKNGDCRCPNCGNNHFAVMKHPNGDKKRFTPI